jgi:predicted esterase
MPSMPSAEDFPKELVPVLRLSPSSKPTNVVVFLPGLGDTSANFASFAKALNLPDTLTVTLQPPYPLPFPFGPGFQWSDDVQVDTSLGTFDLDSPLEKASAMVSDALTTLQTKHGYAPSQIHLLGSGQGGSVALSTALSPQLQGGSFGGIVSIGGAVPVSSRVTAASKNRTPVMLLGGRRGSLSKDEQSPVKRIRGLYEFVEYHEWKKYDDTMPKSRDEALPMMQFLARRLRSTRGVPEGAVEVG